MDPNLTTIITVLTFSFAVYGAYYHWRRLQALDDKITKHELQHKHDSGSSNNNSASGIMLWEAERPLYTMSEVIAETQRHGIQVATDIDLLNAFDNGFRNASYGWFLDRSGMIPGNRKITHMRDREVFLKYECDNQDFCSKDLKAVWIVNKM